MAKKATAKKAAIPDRMSAKQYRDLVIDQLPQFAPIQKGKPAKMSDEKPAIRMPKPIKITNVEREWFAECKRRWPTCRIELQPFSLRLPSGTRYTPDIGVFNGDTILRIFETKAAYIKDRKGGIRAFKEAAAHFPEWHWVFAQKRDSGWALTAATQLVEE